MSRIIIADDEAMFLTMAEFILKKEGFDTVRTTSGEECLEQFAAQGAELIVLDVLMPGASGFDVLMPGASGFDVFESLRGQGADVPVLFMTAADDRETLLRAQQLGVPCCRKPFRREELVSAVRSMLNEREQV